MQDQIVEFLSRKSIAVVGATGKKDRYGYVIFRYLLDRGYRVFPVHPALKEIDGVKAYRSLSDIPDTVEAVDIVVNPRVTEKVIDECIRLGIKLVWMQPGAESPAAIEACENNGIACIHDTCVMIHQM